MCIRCQGHLDGLTYKMSTWQPHLHKFSFQLKFQKFCRRVKSHNYIEHLRELSVEQALRKKGGFELKKALNNCSNKKNI